MAQEWTPFRVRRPLTSRQTQLVKMMSIVWNKLFLLTPFEDEVLRIWYPRSSVEVRFHFRVRV